MQGLRAYSTQIWSLGTEPGIDKNQFTRTSAYEQDELTRTRVVLSAWNNEKTEWNLYKGFQTLTTEHSSTWEKGVMWWTQLTAWGDLLRRRLWRSSLAEPSSHRVEQIGMGFWEQVVESVQGRGPERRELHKKSTRGSLLRLWPNTDESMPIRKPHKAGEREYS